MQISLQFEEFFDKKKSWKFVYILAKQCRSPFNLTDFLTKKNHNSENLDFREMKWLVKRKKLSRPLKRYTRYTTFFQSYISDCKRGWLMKLWPNSTFKDIRYVRTKLELRDSREMDEKWSTTCHVLGQKWPEGWIIPLIILGTKFWSFYRFKGFIM